MVSFTVTPSLRAALAANKIPLDQYGAAYGGESAGLDLYNASGSALNILPMDSREYLSVAYKLGETEQFKFLISTGLRVAIPVGYVGLILQRGSVIKTTLIHRAGVIDPGYTKEIFIPVVNLAQRPCEIKEHAKLPFQLVVVPAVNQYRFIESDVYDDTTRYSVRKEACLGSTDVSVPEPEDEKQAPIDPRVDPFDLDSLLHPTAGYL